MVVGRVDGVRDMVGETVAEAEGETEAEGVGERVPGDAVHVVTVMDQVREPTDGVSDGEAGERVAVGVCERVALAVECDGDTPVGVGVRVRVPLGLVSALGLGLHEAERVRLAPRVVVGVRVRVERVRLCVRDPDGGEGLGNALWLELREGLGLRERGRDGVGEWE